ncbi:unnamed protein product [Discula destructiva]
MPIIRIPGRSSRVPSKGGKSAKGGKRPIKGPKKLPPPQRRDSLSSVASSSSLSSPANLSNDDGYSGLEDVSDSEDDDADHVLAAEQEHIANERSSPRPTPDFEIDDDDDDDDDDADDADDDDSDDDLSSPHKDLYKTTPGAALDVTITDTSSEAGSWNGFNDEQDQPPVAQDNIDENDTNTSGGRHVHFALPHSDTDTDDDGENHDGFFPDIFVPEEALDSRFRQEIGLDNDNYSSDSQTYWDHHGDDEFEGFSEDDAKDFDAFYENTLGIDNGLLSMDLPVTFGLSNEGGGPGNDTGDLLGFPSPSHGPGDPFWDITHSNEATAASTPSMVPDVPVDVDGDDESDDGYLSDGETTEEDEPVLIPKDSPMRRSLSRGSSDAEAAPDSPLRRRPAPPRKRVCVLNPITGKLIILTPQPKKRLGPAPGMSAGQFQPDLLSLQTLSFVPGDPIGTGTGPLDTLNEMPWMTPVGYFPPVDLNPPLTPALFPNMGSEGSSTRTDEDEDEEDEGERDLDVDLFLAFDSDDSDAEGGNGNDAEDGEVSNDGRTGNTDKTSGHGGNKASTAFGTLAHLGGMNVGAFRRNQTTQQLIARGEATPDSLAFSNSLFHGTLRGIRDGALPAAATSLTPERRRKPQPTKSPLEVASLKRRASALTGGAHKKPKKHL